MEIKKEPGVKEEPDIVFTSHYFIHFKLNVAASNIYHQMSRLLPGWTYQWKQSNVQYSISTTFRSDQPITYPVALAAYNIVKAHVNVSRCLLLAEVMDWNIEEDEVIEGSLVNEFLSLSIKKEEKK